MVLVPEEKRNIPWSADARLAKKEDQIGVVPDRKAGPGAEGERGEEHSEEERDGCRGARHARPGRRQDGLQWVGNPRG